MMNFRRLLKASRAGPMKVLHSCELKTDLTKKLKCKSDSVSEETSEFVKWLTLSGTLLFATAGTLCKEPAIMVLPLCIFYDFIKTTRHEDPYSKVLEIHVEKKHVFLVSSRCEIYDVRSCMIYEFTLWKGEYRSRWNPSN
ncbi:hypothetical protein ACJJTC_016767 [Scirpophaga incertulas]